MDVVSKEIFFQDNILFVEGQEDVGLLQPHFIDKNINLFGYSVRGCDQFPPALKFAKDLGIKKDCVLIDSPDSSSSDRNEDKIKKTLEEKYKGYSIIQWNKADIRDKEPYTSPEKKGYYTKDGKLKSEEELDDFHEKIGNIVDYFSPKEKP
jgi:hypothetical protein